MVHVADIVHPPTCSTMCSLATQAQLQHQENEAAELEQREREMRHLEVGKRGPCFRGEKFAPHPPGKIVLFTNPL